MVCDPSTVIITVFFFRFAFTATFHCDRESDRPWSTGREMAHHLPGFVNVQAQVASLLRVLRDPRELAVGQSAVVRAGKLPLMSALVPPVRMHEPLRNDLPNIPIDSLHLVCISLRKSETLLSPVQAAGVIRTANTSVTSAFKARTRTCNACTLSESPFSLGIPIRKSRWCGGSR